MNTGEWGSQPEVSAIACPVMDRGRAVAAINLVFMRSAMDLGTLRRRYAPQLRALAADMSEGLSASGGGA
jgi:DNA-binding IclR family transcriptional regulator